METKTECIILWRNTQNNRIGFVADEYGDIEVFPTYGTALAAAGRTTVCKAFPYKIVELDELGKD